MSDPSDPMVFIGGASAPKSVERRERQPAIGRVIEHAERESAEGDERSGGDVARDALEGDASEGGEIDPAAALDDEASTELARAMAKLLADSLLGGEEGASDDGAAGQASRAASDLGDIARTSSAQGDRDASEVRTPSAHPERSAPEARGVEGAAKIVRPATTPILRAVDRHYHDRLFGEPDGSLLFDAGADPLPYRSPRLVEVAWWHWPAGALAAKARLPNDDRPDAARALPLTRLATLGMSRLAQVDGSRTELHMALARDLREDEPLRARLALLLANLAAYPFAYETTLERGAYLTGLAEIPGHPGCTGILLDDLGADPADETIRTAEGKRIDFHLCIPVREDEVDLLRRRGARALRERWGEEGRDRFHA